MACPHSRTPPSWGGGGSEGRARLRKANRKQYIKLNRNVTVVVDKGKTDKELMYRGQCLDASSLVTKLKRTLMHPTIGEHK